MTIPMRGLETHCSHACNLNCQGCSHYSNHHHGSYVPVEQADKEMKLWNKRVNPKRFGILGGEPATHPDLCGFIRMTRINWPDQNIGLTSNGLLLHKHPDLPAVLAGTGTNLTISKHSNHPDYLAAFEPKVLEIQNWCAKYKIPLRILDSTKLWRHQYHGFGENMMPYTDNDPLTSWKNCPAKLCHTLFEGKLWKCPPLAFLKLQKAKFKLNYVWDKYLKYELEGALLSTCSDKEIIEWLGKKEESFCSMCPKVPKLLELPNPLEKEEIESIPSSDPVVFDKIHNKNFAIPKKSIKLI